MSDLLIVESPAKAKTISKYLGGKYTVLASMGHIRDLPSKNGSVIPENDFEIIYQISPRSTKQVNEIVRAAKASDNLILATDPDREGEAIAWHVLEVLKQKKALKKDCKVSRVVFNAITKKSVNEAMENPRDLDAHLIDAQQARRALDYLVGFNLSPILWRKLPGSKSAGRVQSVALRILCDREDEIEKFVSQEYWSIAVDLLNQEKKKITANLTHVNDKKLEKLTIKDKQAAGDIVKNLEDKQYQIEKIIKKQVSRKPYAPFTTSSMQQEAARKLGFGAKKTMMVAQRLYEGIDIGGGNTQGLITYMRTDGVYVAPEAIDTARSYITKKFGEKYLPPKVNIYQSKAKNAQEAHEAIRPVDCMLAPEDIKKYLDNDQYRLYDLVFKRMIASQMANVVMDQVSFVIITLPNYAKLRCAGSVIAFKGFYALYNESKDDQEDDDGSSKILPKCTEGEQLDLKKVSPNQHFTEPPPRFSESSLVKKMEELGIGRPSTYAAIISVLQERDYVKLEKRRFFPKIRGRLVTVFLKNFFPAYVEYNYTASVENQLDEIASGDLKWKSFLDQFWSQFNGNVQIVGDKSTTEVIDTLNENFLETLLKKSQEKEISDVCPTCSEGKLGIKFGRFGIFLGCTNYPECRHTQKLFDDANGATENGDAGGDADKLPKSLGFNGKIEILLKKGPYGFYLEEKDDDKAGKPKRASIPKHINIDDLDINKAKKIVSMPREIGLHPDDNQPITAGIGRYGPYLLYNKKYTSLKEDDVLEVGLNRAVDILSKSKK